MLNHCHELPYIHCIDAMRAHELARILLAGPNAEVSTWDAAHKCDAAIEQIIDVRGVLVLGMDIDDPGFVDGAEVIYTEHDTALRGLVKAQAVANQSKREAV